MSQLEGKKVLITGGASGIGLLMGEMLLSKGVSKLVIWDINQQLMDKAVQKFQQQGYHTEAMVTDVSNRESVELSAQKCLEQNFVPDILILNAGIVSGRYFHDHATGEIEKTIGVNVLGCMLTAAVFLPDMIKRGSGHLVSIASAAGMLSNPKMAVYAASKWAVLGWSESVRLEMEQLKTGIRVTTVTPSYIDTGMFDGVRSNALIPRLKPEKAASKIVRGIEKNKIFVRMPAMVYAIPFVKGILPARWFDTIVGKGLGVYKTMSTFTGRK